MGLLAQRPVSVRVPKGALTAHSLGLKMECNNNAGMVDRFSGFDMESTSFGDNLLPTDVRPYVRGLDTIFMCADDRFNVNLVPGSTDISGDPNPTTQGGVGYAFYRCAPTVTGSTLAQIAADPCVANNGESPFDTLAIAVPENFAMGDYTLTLANDNADGFTFPGLFPSMDGMPSPVVLTLAPITFDSVVPTTQEAFYEGSPIGSCVDVSTTQTFTVAYLNPITVANLNTNPAGCEGFFDVRGGTPELRGGTGYNIVIENTLTNERAAILTSPADIVHNGIINYEVPSLGTYLITIEDGNSCSLGRGLGVTVEHFEGCPLPLVVNFPFENGLPDESICVPVIVENFTNISGFQFEFSFDFSVLRFDSLSGFNTSLPNETFYNGPPSSGGTRPDGEVRVSYSDFTGGATDLTDGSIIFTACFTIIGSIGESSPLSQNGTLTEYSRLGGETGDIIINPGAIVVTDKAFLVELTSNNEVCEGFNDGSITATASGAPSPYIFSIRRISPNPEALFRDARTRNDNPASVIFNGLEDAVYAVQVEAAGEFVTDTIEVEGGFDISVRVLPVNSPSCSGFADGSVRAAVEANGVEIVDPLSLGYTFQWQNSAETGDVRTGLVTGTYEVTVTAPNRICTDNNDLRLTEPSRVRIRPDVVTDATCSGSPDGSISITADGGTGPYDFIWPNMLGTDFDVVASNRLTLVPDAYEVIVEDSRGCRDTSNFVVDARKTLDIVSEIDSITCFGDDNGAIRVNGTATGAAPVGNYEVSLINLTTAFVGPFQEITNNSIPFEFNNLGPGRYVVVLRDMDPAGCETMDTFTIFEPPLLDIDNNPTIRNETCTVGEDGSIMAAVSGGTTPYVYRWVNDSLDMPIDTITPGNSLTGLRADTNYVLIVTDNNGCMDSLRFRINAPAGATLSAVDTSFISCPGDNDGQLAVLAVPPTGETITSITWYNLNSDGSLGAVVATGPATLNNLPVGNYAVEVVTSNSCSAFAVGAVVSPGEVFLRDFVANDPQCPGDANGSIFVNPGGGTPNADGTYNYVWSTDPFAAPTTNPAFTNLRAGSYTVTITDGNGCQPPFDTTFILTDPPAISGMFTTTPVSCPDDFAADGQAIFSANYSDGSAGTFNFTWTGSNNMTTGATQSTETGLSRGPVTVRVSDGICSASFTDTIRSPEEFAVEVLTESVSCNGLMDGAATVVISGGTPGYNYAWSVAGDTDSIVNGLAAGTNFTVDITDANGCSPGTQTFAIAQPDPLTLSIDPVQTTSTVRCAGDANGRISVFISSVNNNELADSPYRWSGNVAGGNDMLATDLTPGTYSVTVTDVEGCQDSLRYTIGEPEAIVFSVLPIEEPLCFGVTTPVLIDTAFGGTSTGIQDFTFSVNNDGFRIPVGQMGTAFAGEVVVTVFDSVGCSAEQTFSVNQPPQILIDLPEEITIELGDSLTRLNPLISPAGDVYSYLWTPADFLSADTVRNPLIFPFESRDYVLQVTNANGCQAFADIFVEVDANRNVYIPNVFSPNRDGRNDDFRIFACQGVRSVNSVQVFDRWGGVVYTNDDLEPNCLDGIQLWDGTGQNGKPVNPAVFVYIIEVEFLDNIKLLYRGDITVLR